jgi:hypothetical protein
MNVFITKRFSGFLMVAMVVFLVDGLQLTMAQETGVFLDSPEELITTETITRDGITYIRGSVPIPTGKLSSSGMLLEKIVPREVSVGKVFSYEYRAQNLTEQNLVDVAIFDKITPNFEATDSFPTQPMVQNGIARWDLGTLGPREAKIIRIEGRAKSEGEITTCGWAVFQPSICNTISVTRADLEVSLVAPQVSLASQPIRYEAKVKNTGSSALTSLRLTARIPNGLQSFTGAENVELTRPVLGVGEEAVFNFELQANDAGEFPIELNVASAQGAADSASVVTEVRAPVLQISADSPEQRYIGRPVNVCLSIENTGTASARAPFVEISLPPGVDFVSADEGGRSFGTAVRWDLPELAAGDTRDLCVTVVASAPGEYTFVGSTSGSGLITRTASTTVRFAGIPAIAMDVRDIPDPVEVGKELVYEITVTNQGTAPASNVIIVCEMEDAQEFINSYGESTARLGERKSVDGRSVQEIIMEPVVRIEPQTTVSWRVTVKALKREDVRFTVRMSSDQLTRPNVDIESTFQY